MVIQIRNWRLNYLIAKCRQSGVRLGSCDKGVKCRTLKAQLSSRVAVSVPQCQMYVTLLPPPFPPASFRHTWSFLSVMDVCAQATPHLNCIPKRDKSLGHTPPTKNSCTAYSSLVPTTSLGTTLNLHCKISNLALRRSAITQSRH